MNAKEIGRKAGRIFEYHLPDHWIFRSQEDQEDYGIDGEIELANESDQVTGFIFKAQIKGQESVSFIENGSMVSFSLKLERLKYYMQEVEIPVILIVVDVTKEQIFWKSLQDDAQLREIMSSALSSNQKTVSVHIPVTDCLPDKYGELLAAVDANMNWLRVSALSRMTSPIDAIVKKSPNDLIAEMLEKSKQLNFHLFSESFERLYVSGDFDALFDSAKDVLISATEKLETRFCAGLYIERVYLQKVDPRSEEYQSLCLNLYVLLLNLVRDNKAAEHIRLYSILLLRSIKLNFSVDADYHYYLSAKMTENDDLTRWVVDFSRSQVVLKAAREVEKVIHLTNRIILSGNKYLLLETLPRVGSKIAIFAHRLSLDGLEQQAHYLYSWLKFCIDLAVNLARELEKENFIAEIIILNSTFKLHTSDADFLLDESNELAKSIRHESIRASVTDTIARIKLDIKRTNEDATPEEELKFYRERAKALGFNYDDPDDEMGQIINQGLKDYNPERVLRDCEHIVVFPSGSRGIPARMVGLPSAAMKWIYCSKFGHAMGGWALDNIYKSPIKEYGFENQYCKGCEYKKPRSDDWSWNSKWQNEEIKKHKDIITEIDSM
ncbi:DUF4365 domain-containing protein [Shewanella sp. GD03713]|uniref:DUF4365 domain-containing protein n=1 Tax=Shewanella sp. GD03713 TaxID=2975372 RepID=UPI0015947EC8|nr:DUF4365 domain-containing protein [Shewanella sp. GD03713]MDH1471180.1 DUF4365 domain-containing protein [Shewanella sp. GD03713]QXN26188.1 DUF4365 domain-containing protein [Shewanella putrefaciens]